ncbi:helix-turn-helix domain-containing protein [Paenibacillus eucommiae]|uniref:YesN/AraC family two-component response regulator n=1 Tax=Paenibacillus eucommiae TaxID=1355755 RepID=A0ABS4J019_9BACL|nr:AraC family transcriptional regulator [Paenibacillus eucommiae]MBP1993182.1 YesN/AraC family two-component response regulator [Paenibacillus eucommiae]
MLKSHLSRFQKNGLFVKLLSSFLLLTILLLSFNFLSLSFFKNNIQNEIIKQNSLNLKKTVDSYEGHLELIDNLLTGLQFNPVVELLTDREMNAANSELINQLTDQLNTLISNPYLYLDNVLIYFKESDSIIDKGGKSSVSQMFGNYYVTPDYDISFWEKQFQENYHLKLFPAAEFSEIKYDKKLAKGTLFPIFIKNNIDNRVSIIAMLDASDVFTNFHISSSDSFFIMNSKHDYLFASTSEPIGNRSSIDAAWPNQPSGYVKKDEHYYFYKTGPSTGFTYMNIIPNQKIADEVFRLQFVFILIFIATLVISIVISVVLSMKFNNPVQKIIHSIEDLRKDLKRKNSLLIHYGYMNKIKSIGSNFHEIQELISNTKPFYIILFELTFTRQFKISHTAEEHSKASNFIREFIYVNINEHFRDSVTFPVEKNQVVSLIFEEQLAAQMIGALQSFKQMFDRDKEYCFLTIAVNPEQKKSLELSESYEQCVQIVRQRKLNDETQIMTELSPAHFELLYTPAQEQELTVHLQAGNVANVVHLVGQLLDKMSKKEASAYQYNQFAEEVISKVLKTLILENVQVSSLLAANSPYQQIKDFTTIEDYKVFFEHFLAEAVQLIASKKSEKEPIIDYITDYLINHYGEDISLELIANKLNLSSGYLSIYFKEKKGVNFSTFLNDIRITKAKDMLRKSEYKIHEIASQVGYQNANSFIRMFKKCAGIPPSEFRRLHSEDMQ